MAQKTGPAVPQPPPERNSLGVEGVQMPDEPKGPTPRDGSWDPPGQPMPGRGQEGARPNPSGPLPGTAPLGSPRRAPTDDLPPDLRTGRD